MALRAAPTSSISHYTPSDGGELTRAGSSEGELKAPCLGAADHHFLRGFPGFEMVSGNHVFSRWQACGKSEEAIGIGHGKKRVGQHADVSKHPRMHVAFQPHEDFGEGEALLNDPIVGPQRQVETLVDRGCGMDVVQDWGRDRQLENLDY